MKSVEKHNQTLRFILSSLAFLFLFTYQLSAQNIENGKTLYNANCAACHKLEGKLIGPPLKGIGKKRSKEWLKAWIKDNAALRASGDADAIAIYEEYNQLPMVAYPQFSDEDLEDIIAYMDGKPKVDGQSTATAVTSTGASGIDSTQVRTGKKIFNANCASCHKLQGTLIGPELGGVEERRTNEWLKAWIKDNAALRASGDADAIAIFNEYNGSVMTAFPQLSDEDIDAILAYTTHGDIDKKVAAGNEGVQEVPKKPSTAWMSYVVLFVLLLLVLWVYFKSNNEFLKLVTTIALLLTTAYFGYNGMMNLGVDEGYQPIQPIAFSHKIHAGDNKIDCQYCHSSAKHSKTSGIPSVNVCMNCHKGISEVAENTSIVVDGKTLGKAELDGEIQKIYDAIGWDKDKLRYIENYEQKPVKWTRIHNLPDFAYFNHSQHVTVGGLKCQQCHGPVEEMDEMRQFSPLTMGWCIECHKGTEVDLKGNEYYAKIHEELSKKYGVEKVTVAQMGGKECGKCHY